MNLQPIDVDRNEARKAFLEYRGSVRSLLDKEVDAADAKRREALRAQREHDEAIMRGYRLIAAGKQIISLAETIVAGGVDELHRPKLAIARADNRRIKCDIYRNGSVRFLGSWQRNNHRNPRTLDRIELPEKTLPGWTGGDFSARWSAIVPSIPPRFRPAELTNYHLLWEADWRRPPVDPALLRALGNGLYVVVATWDLTALERAVLGTRAG